MKPTGKQIQEELTNLYGGKPTTKDLIGHTYLLQIGQHAGHKATIIGKDPLFPDEDRWLVTANGHTWGVSGIALRSVLADQKCCEPLSRFYG